MSSLRWGIISAGHISHDFICALRTLPAENHEIVAIAARTLEHAKIFAEVHNIPKIYVTYEEIASDKDVDIAYIGLINTLHFDIAKMMIDAGKHVICEKPLTMNKKQTEALIKHAQAKGVFFMEAIWSRSFPVYKKLAEMINDGVIGGVQFVNVTFGFPLDSVDRVNVKKLGGGGILDIGIYTLQFAQYVFRGQKPTSLTGTGYLNHHGVDNSATCIIQYPANKSAVLTISTTVQLPNEAVVVGSKGTIKIPNFWSPTKLFLQDKLFYECELPKSKDTYNFANSEGLSYEAEECRRCIQAELTETPTITHKESLQLADLMDSWRKCVGVVYDEDL